MTNVSPFISKESIQKQACEWISKIDRGLNHEEKSSLGQWIETSESHRSSLFSMAKTWDDLSALNELKGLFPSSSQQKVASQRQVYSDRSRRFIAASVACFFFACVGLAVNHQMNISADPVNLLVQSLTAETKVGEHKSVTLNDGSIVHLNTNSALQVDFSAGRRFISLQKGEAYFDVAHDAERPFVVDTGSKTVTAVGTAFSMQVASKGEFELLVTEGKVVVQDSLGEKSTEDLRTSPITVGPNSDGALMEAGQKAIFQEQSTQHFELTDTQIQNELAWQQGMLVFHGEYLPKALQEIARYTSIRFSITDENVKFQKVAGYFKAGDIDGLLFALENNFNIAYSKQDNGTIVLYSGASR